MCKGMAGEDTSGRWRSHWPKRLWYGQTATQARGSKATGAGGRQPARQQGAVVSSPVPRSTPEARAIERAFAREITERLCREGVARLCRAERASGSERVCCSMMCGVVVLWCDGAWIGLRLSLPVCVRDSKKVQSNQDYSIALDFCNSSRI